MRGTIATITLSVLLILGLTSLGLAAPPATALGPTSKNEKTKSLYTRLGGKKAITAVVDEFVNNVAADNRINSFFAKTA
ncbi:MAG TPA: hypothetical protein VJX67_23315, partial [Blastocatellia bacterium]|nr:hypothetical protein [Blastocatellia bacterium]